MKIIELNLLDGKSPVEIVVKDVESEIRLKAFYADARKALELKEEVKEYTNGGETLEEMAKSTFYRGLYDQIS